MFTPSTMSYRRSQSRQLPSTSRRQYDRRVRLLQISTSTTSIASTPSLEDDSMPLSDENKRRPFVVAAGPPPAATTMIQGIVMTFAVAAIAGIAIWEQILHHPGSVGSPAVLTATKMALANPTAMISTIHTLVHYVDDVITTTLHQWYESYELALTNHPVATKSATSATVYTIGDIIAQRTEQQQQQKPADVVVNDDATATFSLDIPRILRSCLAGGIGHGPLSHIWYMTSEHIFTSVLGWTAWWSVIPKIVIDQTVWGPIWNTLYLLSIGIMQQLQQVQNVNNDNNSNNKMDMTELWEDVQTSIWPLFVDGLKLWPLAHIVTYGVMPVENRLVWVDLVEIVWVSIMATKAASTPTAADEIMAAETDLTTNTNKRETNNKNDNHVINDMNLSDVTSISMAQL